jgi:predicted AAA+ superfamily ATPase
LNSCNDNRYGVREGVSCQLINSIYLNREMIQTTLAKKVLEDLNLWHLSGYHHPSLTPNRVAHRTLNRIEDSDSSIFIINGFSRQGKTYTLNSIANCLLNTVKSTKQVVLLDLSLPIFRSADLSLLLKDWNKGQASTISTCYLLIDNAHLIGKKITADIENIARSQKHIKIITTGISGGKWKSLLTNIQRNLHLEISEDFIDEYTFFDYLTHHSIDTSAFSTIDNFRNLFNFSQHDFDQLKIAGHELENHFNKYLCIGAHPAALKCDTATEAQEWIRTQFTNKVLEIDIVPSQKSSDQNEIVRVLFALVTEKHPLIELNELCESLGLTKPLAFKYLKELVDTGLMSRVSPVEYKSGINRALHMFLMRSPELLCALLHNGDDLQFSDSNIHALILSAVHLHLRNRNSAKHDTVGHGHKKGKLGPEFVVKMRGSKNSTPEEKNIIFDINYSDQNLGNADLRSIEYACTKAGIEKGYMITKSFNDFGWSEVKSDGRLKTGKKEIRTIKVLRIPAALLCYFLVKQGQSDGRASLMQPSRSNDPNNDLPFRPLS